MAVRARCGLAGLCLLLLPIWGCARAPASAGSGVRLVVTLRFNGPINDNYQYFVLLRNAADASGQNGPVPVIAPPYFNGFATGQNTATAGFTDMVEYSRVQRQFTTSGYCLYHLPGGISGDPNANVFEPRGEPDRAQGPAGSAVLQFELDLSRLQPGATEPDPNNGERPRYLQVNVLATTTTPNDPVNLDTAKVIDALGDQRPGSGTFNMHVTIDTATNRVYNSSQSPGDTFYEPDLDTYPTASDPAIDLLSWSIQVTGA